MSAQDKNHQQNKIESYEPLILMSASAIEIEGTDAGEWISGTDAENIINAGGGNDEIHAPIGNNIVDGGDGYDSLVIYEGVQDDYQISVDADGNTVVEGPGGNGQLVRNVIFNVEQVVFNDGWASVEELREDAPVVDPADPVDPDDGDEPSASANSGSANSGSANSGSANSGSANSGSANSGSANSGSANSGSANSGSASNNSTPTLPGDSDKISGTATPGEGMQGWILEPNHDLGPDVWVDVKSWPANGYIMVTADGEFDYIPYHGFSGEDRFEVVIMNGHEVIGSKEVCVQVGDVQDPTSPDDGDDEPSSSGKSGSAKSGSAKSGSAKSGAIPPVGTPAKTPTIVGTDAGEWVNAGTDDVVAAKGGNDEIYAPNGAQLIDGGDGIDSLVIYEGSKADYSFYRDAHGNCVVEGPGANGSIVTQTITNVEKIIFNDGWISVSDIKGDDPGTPVDPEEPEEPSTSGNSGSGKSGSGKSGSGKSGSGNSGSGNSGSGNSGNSGSGNSGSGNSGSGNSGSGNSGSGNSGSGNSGSGNSGSGSVIHPPNNQQPDAVNDSFETVEDEPVWGNVLTNDHDANDDQLTVTLKSAPTKGYLSLSSDGSFDYVPEWGWYGKDTFEYTVSDGKGGTDHAIVTIWVEQADNDDDNSAKSGSGKSGSSKSGSGKSGSGKSGSGKSGSAKSGSGKSGSAKSGSDKSDSGKSGK